MVYCLLFCVATIVTLLPRTHAHGCIDPYKRIHNNHGSMYVPGFSGTVPARPQAHTRYHIPVLSNYHYVEPSGALYAVTSGGQPGINRLRRFREFRATEGVVARGDEPPFDWRDHKNAEVYAKWRKNTTRSEWIRTIRNIYLSAWYADRNDLSIDRVSLQTKMENYFPGSHLRLILSPPGLTGLSNTSQRPFYPISAKTPLFNYYATIHGATTTKKFTLDQDCVILHRFRVQEPIGSLAPLMLVLIFSETKPCVSQSFHQSIKARQEESVKLFVMEGKRCHSGSRFGFTSLLETFPGSLHDLLSGLRTRHLSLDLKSPAIAWKLHESNLRSFFPNGYLRTIIPSAHFRFEIKDFNLEPWADVVWPGQLMYRVGVDDLEKNQQPMLKEDMNMWNDHEYDVMLPIESGCSENLLDMNLLATKLSDDFVEDPWPKFVESILDEEDEELLNELVTKISKNLTGKDEGSVTHIIVQTIQQVALPVQKRFQEILEQHCAFALQIQGFAGVDITHFREIHATVLKNVNLFTINVKKSMKEKVLEPKQAWAEVKTSLNASYCSLFGIQHRLAREYGLESFQPLYRHEQLKFMPIEAEGRLLDSPFIVPPRTRLAHVLHLRWDQTRMDEWADILLSTPILSDLEFRMDHAFRFPMPIELRYNFPLSPRLLQNPFTLQEARQHNPPKLLAHPDLPEDDSLNVDGEQAPMTFYDPPVRLEDLDSDADDFPSHEEYDSSVQPSIKPITKFVFETEEPKTINDLDLSEENDSVSLPMTEQSIEQAEQAPPSPSQTDSPMSGAIRIVQDSDKPSTLADLDLTGMEEQPESSPSNSPTSRSPFNPSPPSSRYVSPQSDFGAPSPTHGKLSPSRAVEPDSTADSPVTTTPSRTDSESSDRSTHLDSSVPNSNPHSATDPLESDWSLLRTHYPHLNDSWRSLFGAIVRSFNIPSHLPYLNELLQTYSSTTLPGTSHGTLVAGVPGTITSTIFTPQRSSSSQNPIVRLSCNSQRIYFVPANTKLALIRTGKKTVKRITLPHDAIVFPFSKGNEPVQIPVLQEKVKAKTPLMRWVRFQ